MMPGMNRALGGLFVLALPWAYAASTTEPFFAQTDAQAFTGADGIVVEKGLPASEGFALDFEVFFDDVAREHQIFFQDGLLLLRMDPPTEGGQLSFFVNTNGALEPRLRSVKIEAGTWHRVTASWDGTMMWLRVGDRVFRAERQGGAQAWGKPLKIAAAADGAAGLRGQLRKVRLYSHPLTEVESLLVEEPGEPAAAGQRPASPVFDFDGQDQGWRGVHAAAYIEDGAFCADVSAANAFMLADNLDYAVDQCPVVSVRLSVDDGEWATCYAATSTGKHEVIFPIKADGQMHNYVLWMDQYPEWRGRLQALALRFDSRAKRVKLDLLHCGADVQTPPEFEVESLYAVPPLPRAGREFAVRAMLRNVGGAAKGVAVTLAPPDGLATLDGASRTVDDIPYGGTAEVSWHVLAAKPVAQGRCAVSVGAVTLCPPYGIVNVAPARAITPAEYVPAPVAAKTKRLVGAHYCPLWKEGSRGGGWEQIEPFPERESLLGWYDEQNPEVTDWEIKWAVEHGIGFFVYCWYRASQNAPVETFIGHAIHEGLFNAQYRSQFRFCIMWENQFRGHAGIASEEDLLSNLMPFWIAQYFKNPQYLVIDNKPLLFIYRPEFVIDDLGGKTQARQAFEKMRQACRDAGFDGLYLLGEDRGTAKPPLELMADLGLDYSFSYCWPVGNNPDGPAAVAAQESYWQARKDMGILPDLLTVSMGWDSTPWSPSLTKWRLTPSAFETACRHAAAFMDTLPKDSLASQVVLLDNWNEFGEGHYIAPHRQYGFGYLDAVRNAFADAPAEHEDLVPQDLALGPYDTLYAAKKARETEACKRMFREGGDAPGLIAWWTFDEDGDEPFAWDYTGHGHGGRITGMKRVEGRFGRSAECAGGVIEVPASPDFAPRKGITISCWLKTDVASQDDTWFVNRIHDGHLDAGYRFGLSSGRLTWAVPQSTWSHHLTASEPLPLGRWVHIAGTCDNRNIRIYMDGHQVAELPRYGTVKDGGTRLTLGNYDLNHKAFFRGQLDDMRLYDHALSDEELHALAQVVP